MDRQSTTMTYDGSSTPPEIFKEVIDHLAASLNEQSPLQLKDNMKNVAIVCKAFLPLARMHLFEEIDLSRKHDEDGTRRSNLAQLLASHNNGLARHVHRIKYKFVHEDDDVQEVSQRELVQKFVDLPQVRSLSLTGIGHPYLPDWGRSKEGPLYGWKTILDGFIHRNSSTISSLDIVNISWLSLESIVSIPTLLSLTMTDCSYNYGGLWDIPTLDSDAVKTLDKPCEPSFSLETLRIQGGTHLVSFALVAWCTQLRHLTVAGSLQYGRNPPTKLSSRLGRTPLSRIESLVFENDYQVQWGFLYAAANEEGVPAFPLLKDLTVQVDRYTGYKPATEKMLQFYNFFHHTPALESLRLHGVHLLKVNIPQCLKPLEDTLKSLSLHWRFGDTGLVTQYTEENDITIHDTFQTLLPLRLLALEGLTLHIQLETGIYDEDSQGLLIYRSLAKLLPSLIKRVIVRNHRTRFPNLARVKVKITFMIYEKPCSDELDEEEPYRLLAVDALTKCLGGLKAPKNKFKFSFDVDVFSRSTRFATI